MRVKNSLGLPRVIAVAMLLWLSTTGTARAWDNFVAHELLTDQAVERLSKTGVTEAYIEQELGLEDGLNEELAIQLGFESFLTRPSAERDIAPNGADGGGSRLQEELKLFEEIPEDTVDEIVLGLHEHCSRPSGFEACFGKLRSNGDAVRNPGRVV